MERLDTKKNNIERRRISGWFGENMRRMWFGLEIDVVSLPPLSGEGGSPEFLK